MGKKINFCESFAKDDNFYIWIKMKQGDQSVADYLR
jgi:hypothetical protein